MRRINNEERDGREGGEEEGEERGEEVGGRGTGEEETSGGGEEEDMIEGVMHCSNKKEECTQQRI